SHLAPSPLPFLFFFSSTPPTDLSTLSLHDALPIWLRHRAADRGRLHHDAQVPSQHLPGRRRDAGSGAAQALYRPARARHQLLLRSEEHTSELQSRFDLVCRLLLEKKKKLKIKEQH